MRYILNKLGPNDPLHVTCARCGKEGTSETFMLEEADEWECPECWERCEATERAAVSKWYDEGGKDNSND